MPAAAVPTIREVQEIHIAPAVYPRVRRTVSHPGLPTVSRLGLLIRRCHHRAG